MEIIEILESSEKIERFDCRICLDDDIKENLISPCKCSGFQKHIHLECLNKWRAENINNEKFTSCEICKETFIIKNKFEPEVLIYKEKTNIPCKFLFYLFIIYFLGGLIWSIDISNNYLSFDLLFFGTNNKLLNNIKNEVKITLFYKIGCIYYVSYGAFCISMLFFLIHLLLFLILTTRKKKYLSFMIGNIILYLIQSFNMYISYIMYLIFQDPSLYYSLLIIMSINIYYNILRFIYKHNNIVVLMNKDISSQIILSREENN